MGVIEEVLSKKYCPAAGVVAMMKHSRATIKQVDVSAAMLCSLRHTAGAIPGAVSRM